MFEGYLEDHPRTDVSGWDHLPFISHLYRPFGRGTTLLRGDLLSPCLLTTYKSWDDPPSRVGRGFEFLIIHETAWMFPSFQCLWIDEYVGSERVDPHLPADFRQNWRPSFDPKGTPVFFFFGGGETSAQNPTNQQGRKNESKSTTSSTNSSINYPTDNFNHSSLPVS